MKRLAALQVVLGLSSSIIFAQARTLRFPYFLLQVRKESQEIESISFGVIPDGQIQTYDCDASLEEEESDDREPSDPNRRTLRGECHFDDELFLPIRVDFTVEQQTLEMKKAGFWRKKWAPQEALELLIRVEHLINWWENSYAAELSLPPEFFQYTYDDSERIYFQSSATPEEAEVSFNPAFK